MLNEKLNRLNCMNYHVEYSDGEVIYSTNGLRSLYAYSKIVQDMTFKELCNKMSDNGQVVFIDKRDGEEIILTMI